jgi:Flp pilus assembly protein TadD
VKKGNLAGAFKALHKAIELNPKDADAYNILAIGYYFKKDYNNAWKVIKTARRKGLGREINPRFLKDLKNVSGRDE